MIEKCANPECSRLFRYLHEGSLFSVEFLQKASPPGSPTASEFSPQTPQTQFFWLCSDCYRQGTLAVTGEEGAGKVLLQPITQGGKKASTYNDEQEGKVYKAA